MKPPKSRKIDKNRTPRRPASPSPAGVPIPRRLSADERRAQILTAALQCFGDKGYHATTMDDLVRQSGLSKGSLYWHFESKEEVFLALFDTYFDLWFDASTEAAESEDDAIALLRRELDLSVELFSNERVFILAWVEFLSHPSGRERMRSTYAVAREKLAEVIESGRKTNRIRGGPPAEQVAAAVVGAIEGVMLQALVETDFDLKRNIETTWQILLEGIEA